MYLSIAPADVLKPARRVNRIRRVESGRRSCYPPAMAQSLAHIALLVRDYDEAIAFFCGTLGFTLVEDVPIPEQGKRWVTVAPPGAAAGGASLLLARAAAPEQARFVGDQAGGRVFLFLATDDFARDHAAMQAKGVTFVREPVRTDYGTVAVFLDLYGNRWDLVEYRRP